MIAMRMEGPLFKRNIKDGSCCELPFYFSESSPTKGQKYPEFNFLETFILLFAISLGTLRWLLKADIFVFFSLKKILLPNLVLSRLR